MPKVRLGVSEANFYVWKKKYGKLEFAEFRELRQLRDENARLKCGMADLALVAGRHLRLVYRSRPSARRR